MIINPGTNAMILRNVPLDTTYEHTIYFNTAEAQQAYFSSLSKYSFSNFTYQRVSAGVIRVGIEADNLYDCNYLMFQNAAFGTKWFYAYITKVEYINNQCSEITYEIDVIQTWHFDYSPGICFVERCHTGSDYIGEHIEPEPFDVGEMVFNTYQPLTDYQDMAIIMAIVDVKDMSEAKVYDGIYGAAQLWAFNLDDAAGVADKIDEYVASPSSILSIYMAPKYSVWTNIPDGGVLIPESISGRTQLIGSSVLGTINAYTRLDGYLPHNCKMYTYPYNYLHFDNASGSSLSLRYEFFTDLAPMVQIGGTITQPVALTLYPTNYKGVAVGSTSRGLSLNTETLQLNNYPLCSWNQDTYKAWVAQNALPIAFNALSTGVNSAVAIGTGRPVAGVLSAFNQVQSVVSEGYRASIAADISKGNLNNGGVNSAIGKQTFWYGRVSVNKYTAAVIDSVFDMYGYSVRKSQAVMRNARPEWCYTKTIGACMNGSVPADDMKRICEIYDAGITWWINGAHVGQYNLPNLAINRGISS